MKTSDFFYHLPEERIAQFPHGQRGMSRLLVLKRDKGEIIHTWFRELPEWIEPGDVLVINETKVIPARLFGKTGKDARIEVLLIEEIAGSRWKALFKPMKKAIPGTRLFIEPAGISGTVEAFEAGSDNGTLRLFSLDDPGQRDFLLEKCGHVPLPPYIKRKDTPDDRVRYQTVFARVEGAVAAPTASLHFTSHLIQKLLHRHVKIAPIVLHVGPGTFCPVRTSIPEEHKMQREFYRVPEQTAEIITEAKCSGKKIIAAGTTVMRTLESLEVRNGRVGHGDGFTTLFIYPPFEFKIVDRLITNFHVPCSTLLMLVSAFATRELILRAYNEAINRGYFLLSFGDAMLII